MDSSPYNVKSAFTRAFPAPEYLTMPAVGIDISDYAIKHVMLRSDKRGVRLESHGKSDLPLGTVERGEIKDPETLARLLTRIREEHHYVYAHLALPEEHAFLFQITLPKAASNELTQMLEFHLKEHVPMGADEAVFDYNILRETDEGYEVNVSVYPASIASGYMNILEEAGFTPLSVEIEGQATARTLLLPGTDAPVLIIDIGRNEASLSISTRGIVTFTANLETGGDFFTRAIARGLDLSFQEAERLKLEYGFRDTPESKGVFEALYPTINELKESINKHLMYWRMHTSSGGGEVEEVGHVVLVGGNANLAGMAEYMEAELGVPVSVGNVWQNVLSFEEYIPDIHAVRSLEYATAIGCALRSLMRGN